jgi:ABC-type transport system substrate-binding protein
VTRGVRTWLAAIAVGLALTACADDPAPTQPEETAVEEPTPADPTTSDPAPTPVPGADSPDVVASVEDLASRLGVEPDSVEVVAVQAVTWSDGSKGCAKKGMLYTQSLIEGSRITLQVDGTPYEYHSGGSGRPFLCERPTQ